jgi:hypothetical protein
VVMCSPVLFMVQGFKPDWHQWIFKGKKINSITSFAREVKLGVPCDTFMAYKRALSSW